MNSDSITVKKIARTYPIVGFIGGLVMALLSLGAASTSYASEIRIGQIIPGAGVIHKTVVSIKERRFLNIVKQNTDISCGAAALATILKYVYHLDTSEPRVMEGMIRVSDYALVQNKGFSMLDMARYITAIGFQSKGYKLAPEALVNIKIPTIVLLNIDGYKHFVVLKKIAAASVYLADPALGNRSMSIKDFASGWNGIVFAVVGENRDKHTPLRQLARPLQARNLMTTFIPSNTTQFLEFGFQNTRLYKF